MSIYKYYKINDLFIGHETILNQDIEVKGWVRFLRNQKDMTFINLNDGSTVDCIQIVFNSNILNDEQQQMLTFGSSISVKGTLIKSINEKQLFELKLDKSENIIIYGGIIGTNPLPAKGKITLEFLRTIPHLRPRTNTFGCISRMRHQLAMVTHDFFGKNKQFILVAPPQITQNDCEGGSEAFQVTTLLTDMDKIKKAINKSYVKLADTTILKVKDNSVIGKTEDAIVINNKIDYSDDFFKKPAYLTVSGQLALETYCLALGGVYCYQSAFRADPSKSARHVAEFTMLEVEIPFANLDDNMNIAEEYIKYSINHLINNCISDMDFLDKNYYQIREENDKFKPTLYEYLNDILSNDFHRMKYSEVIKLLLKIQSEGYVFDVTIPETGIFDLKAEHERYLTDVILKKPVFVTNYPKDIKAFYMKSSGIDEELGVECVDCCDLLVPGVGEVLGGSCRISDYEKLLESMKKHGLVDEKGNSDLDYYLDIRKYGTVEHCGFGIGMSRLLMMVTGMENIRDMIEFPRTIGSIHF